MRRGYEPFFSFLIALILFASNAQAAVELSLADEPPRRIEDVYNFQGIAYLDIDTVLQSLGMKGDWDSVAHVYRFRTPRAQATFYPGSRYLVVGQQFLPLEHSPRFIDGRLRVPEDFVTVHLAGLIDRPLNYRNLDPLPDREPEEGAVDRLFSFLLSKKKPQGTPTLQSLAIDPGHGGEDPGVLGIDGLKEKEVTLAVAQHLEKLVKMDLGIPVHLSRDSDYSLNHEQRFEVLGRSGADALILLHAQAAFDASRTGMTLVVRPDSLSQPPAASGRAPGESMNLAKKLKRVLESHGFTVADILEAPLLPLGQGDLPTVLIEMGYLSNSDDAALLRNKDTQQRIAKALFEGVKEFSRTAKEVLP